ncbi:ABC transporter permease [Phytohabitans aurantiacus]|jgi:peptide/nickel transport system permease protein|uniref:Peptide ABC transporter permease n=1 Tax=Phytohabitans aurantiacus TaxID=3016789 RepID=A0ABQ5QQB3_9ACTN|nr:ABC transporter permease [Phytohabitans aurantiacus]GLH96833.1 peptide ABC transporter permease [Phytohabitans aurantiacus]
MIRVIVKRLLVGVLVMWGAASLIFLIVRVAPGDPATILLGPDADPAQIAELTTRLGLDQPKLTQYVHFLADVARFDFGESYRLGRPAMSEVLTRLPATAELMLTSTAIAVVFGVTLGLLAGARPGRMVDRVVSASTIALQSFPTFWVGIMLILVFALWLGVLPSADAGTPAHLVLPAVTLALPFTATVARLTRTSVAETMREPYIQTARSKGLTEPQVLLGHALRNSLIPVVTIVGLHMGGLMGGAVIVENVFAWPGLGSLIVDAVAGRDYEVVQAATFLIAGIVMLFNLVADLLYSRLDPRIKLDTVS